MINPAYFINEPEDFKHKCKIYPPTVRDAATGKLGIYKKILTMSQEELEDEFFKDPNSKPENLPTPFEYILASSYNNEEFEQLAYKAFEFFLHEEVTFFYDKKKILVGNLEKIALTLDLDSIQELKFIEEDEFFDLQNKIRECCGDKAIEPPNPNEDPRVKRIKAKARYRDRIKAKQGLGISLGTIMASICCMGIGITPLNIGELSYAALLGLKEYWQEKDQYESEVRMLLAGADSKKIKPKYWIRNLE